jgi:hypothetical protein
MVIPEPSHLLQWKLWVLENKEAKTEVGPGGMAQVVEHQASIRS